MNEFYATVDNAPDHLVLMWLVLALCAMYVLWDKGGGE